MGREAWKNESPYDFAERKRRREEGLDIKTGRTPEPEPEVSDPIGKPSELVSANTLPNTVLKQPMSRQEVIRNEALSRPKAGPIRAPQPAQLANWRRQLLDSERLSQYADKAVPEAAHLAGVGQREVSTLRAIHRLDPTVKGMIEAGRLSPSAASDIAILPMPIHQVLANAYLAGTISAADLNHRTLKTGRIAYLRECITQANIPWPIKVTDDFV